MKMPVPLLEVCRPVVALAVSMTLFNDKLKLASRAGETKKPPAFVQTDGGRTKPATNWQPFMNYLQLPTSYFSSRKDCLMGLLHQHYNEVKKTRQLFKLTGNHVPLTTNQPFQKVPAPPLEDLPILW